MRDISKLTKNAITASLVRLMSKMPLDKITVKDIVDDCDISRNTFYYNYQDIYAVIEQLFETELNWILESRSLHQSWRQVFSDICVFLYEYKSAVYSMYRSSRRDFVESQIKKLVYECMSQTVESLSAEYGGVEYETQTVIQFYAYAAQGFVSAWIESGMAEPVQSLVMRAGGLFEDSMKHIFKNPPESFSTD